MSQFLKDKHTRELQELQTILKTITKFYCARQPIIAWKNKKNSPQPFQVGVSQCVNVDEYQFRVKSIQGPNKLMNNFNKFVIMIIPLSVQI